MGLYLGSTDISAADFYLGSNTVSAIYQGSNQLYPGGVGPAPVTADLLFSIDAQSYAGSGTTWADDSGNGWDAILVNSPTYVSAGDGSYFTFTAASSQWAYLPYSHWNGVTPNNYPFTDMGNSIGGGVDYSMEYVVWTNVTTDQSLGTIWGTSAQRSMTSVLRVSQQRFFFGTYYPSSNYFTDPGVPTGTQIGTGKWLHIVHTSNTSTNESVIYVNGSVYYAPGSNQQARWAGFNTRNLILLGQDNGTGTAGSFFLDGRSAVIRGYDRGLTAAEVSQQYAYYQTRYTF